VRIYALSMVITTVNVVIGYYLQSIEQSFTAAILISLRSFVIFLSAALVLGKIFGINGIWAAYIVAETITLGICMIIFRQKRAAMAQAGIRANRFLLDAEIEANIRCFTFDCSRDDFAVFCKQIGESLSADEYLSWLEGCMNIKQGRFVEVEIHDSEASALIRDNLKHGNLPQAVLEKAAGTGKTEYGPVLGWNRLCIEAVGEQ